MAVHQERQISWNFIQFQPSIELGLESFFGSALWAQIQRWYDTETQEVFTVPTEGENIVPVLSLIVGGSQRLVFYGEWIAKSLADSSFTVYSEEEKNQRFVAVSDYSTY